MKVVKYFCSVIAIFLFLSNCFSVKRQERILEWCVADIYWANKTSEIVEELLCKTKSVTNDYHKLQQALEDSTLNRKTISLSYDPSYFPIEIGSTFVYAKLDEDKLDPTEIYSNTTKAISTCNAKKIFEVSGDNYISGIFKTIGSRFCACIRCKNATRTKYVEIDLNGKVYLDTNNGKFDHSYYTGLSDALKIDFIQSFVNEGKEAVYLHCSSPRTASTSILRHTTSEELFQPTICPINPSSIIDYSTIIFQNEGFEHVGHLYAPKGCAKKKLLILLSGGPDVVDNHFNHLAFYLCSNGISMASMNYRGSSGFGHQYESAIYGDIGGGHVRDCEAGIKFLKNIGFEEIYAYGHSFDGLTVMSWISHNQEFAAKNLNGIICGAGVLDYKKMMNHFISLKVDIRCIPNFTTQLLGDAIDTSKTQSIDILKSRITEANNKISPLVKFKSDSWTTLTRIPPVILFHSKDDKLVPETMSEECYRALLKKGIDVKYIRFENSGHSLTDDPDCIEIYMRSILNFINKDSDI